MVRKLAVLLKVSEMAGPDCSLAKLSGMRSFQFEKRHLLKAMDILEVEQNRLPLLLGELDLHPDTAKVNAIKQLVVKHEEKFGEPMPHSTLLQRARYSAGASAQVAAYVKTLVDAHEMVIVTQGRGRSYSVQQATARRGRPR
jgi:hypothetical protein